MKFSEHGLLKIMSRKERDGNQWKCENVSKIILGVEWLCKIKVLPRHFMYICCTYKQRFFSTQPQCCLTSSWIELQMLIGCCLIHINIILVRQFLYLLYLCPRLDLGLFMPCLCDLIVYFYLHFHYDKSYNLMNTDIYVLLIIF